MRTIGATIEVIEAHPLAGRPRSELRPGLHSIAASPHIVFYRIVAGLPEIVRVLDGRRDIDQLFTETDG